MKMITIKKSRKAQISIEYLIIISFITFIIISILGIAFFYAENITDKIKMDQVQSYANKIISSSESVYYAGKPSKVLINVYLPQGVEGIQVLNKDILFNVTTNSGITVIAFSSKVPLTGTLSKGEGVKAVNIVAEEDRVTLSEI